MIRQSTVIFGSLIFAFIVYITMRGQLPAWLNLFRKDGSTGSDAGLTMPAPNTVGSLPGSTFPYPIPNFGH